MKGVIKLIPPDKSGKLKVKAGDTIYRIDGIPYRLEVCISEEKVR